jgi:multiple sugar transport system permease protein
MRAYLVLDAAHLEGAGRIRTFVSIVLPMSCNALITAGLFTLLFTWSGFLFALTLTSLPPPTSAR